MGKFQKLTNASPEIVLESHGRPQAAAVGNSASGPIAAPMTGRPQGETASEPPTDDEILEKQLIESHLREDLKPIEQAKAFQRVMEARAWSATRMAEELGISPPTVTRALAMLRLPEDIQQAVDAGALPPRTAAEIGTLDNPAERRELALEALTRDQVSEAVQKRKAARGIPRKGRRPRKPSITPGNARGDYTLADGTRVSIQGPRQGSPASRLEALREALREAIAIAEAELAEQGGDAQAA